MNAYLESLDTAADEAAYAITLRLHKHLIGHGWPRNVVQSVQIIRTSSGFDVDYNGPHAEDALTLEYGNEFRRPAASVRKFLNNEALLYQLYFDRLEDQLGEIL